MNLSISKSKIIASLTALFVAIVALFMLAGCGGETGLNIKNPNYNSENTPVVLHITGNDFETYHAVNSSEEQYSLDKGNYSIEIISEVDKEGKVSKYNKENVEVKGSTEFKIDPQSKVDYFGETQSVVNKLTEAVKKGDETISGDTGKKIVETAQKRLEDFKYTYYDSQYHFGTYVCQDPYRKITIKLEYRDGEPYATYQDGNDAPIVCKCKYENGFDHFAFRMNAVDKSSIGPG